MNLINYLFSLSQVDDEDTSDNALQALVELKDHPDKNIRLAISKRFICLILNRNDVTDFAVLENFKDVHCEKCCCVKYVKTVGLSELAKSKNEEIRLWAIRELLKLKNDESNKIRFIVVSTIRNFSSLFLNRYSNLALEVNSAKKKWMSDKNEWIRSESIIISD